MTAYIVRRLLLALLVIVLVSIAVFVVMHILPGDPLIIFMGDAPMDLTEETLAALRHEFGLDKPLILQYTSWLGGILRGDFGTSIQYQRAQVSTLLWERYPVTVYLGLISFFISTFIGVGVGLISGIRRGKLIDQLTTVFTYLGVATPGFWLGILMMYAFSLQLHILPTSGFTSPFEDFWLSTKQIIMPVICLSIPAIAVTARQMRTGIIQVTRQDYIRTAWAKGLRESAVISRHTLKNSLIPTITVIGMNIRNIFGGSVITETIFAIPGVGRLLVSSIWGHDYMVVQSITLILAVGIVMTNLIVDISYGWLDPRIRYS